MFERYTDQARRVILFARYEASQYGTPQIETEHLLLGLLRVDRLFFNRLLGSAGSAESTEKMVRLPMKKGSQIPTSVEIPLSESSVRVLRFASEEAERFALRHVDTHHLLLGILREGDCPAAKSLRESGIGRPQILDWLNLGTREHLMHGARNQLELIEMAWIEGSRLAFAMLFDAQAQITDWHGSIWKGRDAIQECFAKMRAEFSQQIKVNRAEAEDRFVGSLGIMHCVIRSTNTAGRAMRVTAFLSEKLHEWQIMEMQFTEIRAERSESASIKG